MMNRLVIIGLVLIWSVAVMAEDLHSEECASIDSDSARLACFDRLSGNSAVLGETKNPVAENNTATDISTVELFGKSTAEQNRILEQSVDADHLKFIDALVEQVELNRFGKMTIALSNQQTWKQSDSIRLHLKVGDEVRIKRAAMGSYLLQKSSGSSSIRVKRID